MRESTIRAYAAIQAMSSKRHKMINMALCRLAREHLEELYFEDRDFEVVQGGEVCTDAVIRFRDRCYSLEFHHLSEGQCSAANMASYIMGKLRTYSWYHQIIPR